MKNIDMKEFLEEFRKAYNFLYNSDEEIDDYYEKLDAGDTFIRDNKEFVGEFAKFRGDYVSSDREVVALMLTVEKLMPEKALEYAVKMENENFTDLTIRDLCKQELEKVVSEGYIKNWDGCVGDELQAFIDCLPKSITNYDDISKEDCETFLYNNRNNLGEILFDLENNGFAVPKVYFFNSPDGKEAVDTVNSLLHLGCDVYFEELLDELQKEQVKEKSLDNLINNAENKKNNQEKNDKSKDVRNLNVLEEI